MKWWLVLAVVASIVDETLEGDSFFIAGVVVSVVIGFGYGFIRDVLAWNRQCDAIVANAMATFDYLGDIIEVRSSFWKREIRMLIGGATWNESFD